MPEMGKQFIEQGWKAFAALKKSKPTGFQQATVDFQAQQPAIANWLRDTDKEWFGGTVVLFEYGLFAWLMFKQSHKQVRTVSDEELDQLCREELASEEALAHESDFAKDRWVEEKGPSTKQIMLKGFLAAELYGEHASMPQLVPKNARVGGVRLSHCITALADASL